jgi:hypothetical protein
MRFQVRGRTLRENPGLERSANEIGQIKQQVLIIRAENIVRVGIS